MDKLKPLNVHQMLEKYGDLTGWNEVENSIINYDHDGLIAISLLNHLNLGEFDPELGSLATTLICELTCLGSYRYVGWKKPNLMTEEDRIYLRMVQGKVRAILKKRLLKGKDL